VKQQPIADNCTQSCKAYRRSQPQEQLAQNHVVQQDLPFNTPGHGRAQPSDPPDSTTVLCLNTVRLPTKSHLQGRSHSSNTASLAKT
jgi:hypothetical protein